MSRDAMVHLSKHHGAGNDFLVLVDPAGTRPVSEDEARALCDPHRGVGADGIARVREGGAEADLAMDLRNADGSVAAMSGNGIRCVVQAALEARLVGPGPVAVRTGAGMRRVDYREERPGFGYATVEMGGAELGPELQLEFGPGPELEDRTAVLRARRVDIGNPHLVLLCGTLDDDLVRGRGARLSASSTGGINVEFVSTTAAADVLRVRVYERGVGETLACGTGACAAAAAAHGWGLVGTQVEVLVPGGSLEVGIDGTSVSLRGPTRKVAEVAVPETTLEELVHELAAAPGRGPHAAVGHSAGEMAGRR